MRPNFKGDKRRKEELRKKKQEEKGINALNKQTQVSQLDSSGFSLPEGTTALSSTQVQ